MRNRSFPNHAGDHVFYTSPFAVARILCSFFLIVIASMYALMFLLMPVAEAVSLALPLLPLIGIGILGEMALALVISRLSPIRVNDSGITIRDAWGRQRTRSWGEIQSVSATQCLSVPCLKVSAFRSDRTPFLLPMTIARSPEFRESVSRCASPINPVRRFVESGGESARRELV